MKLEKISNIEYQRFCCSKNQNHFLHSPKWGEFRQKINWEYEIIGGYQNDILVVAALIQYKKIKYFPQYFAYIPRGMILDYDDSDLIHDFICTLKKYLKKKKVFMLKIDPDISYQKVDSHFKPLVDKNNHQMIDNLKNSGFKHLGFYNNFEGMQPRHTFRITTNFTSIDEIYRVMDKKTRNAIKVASKKGVELYQGNINDLDEFMELLQITASRDGFGIRNKKYFFELLKAFGEDAKLLFARLNFTNAIKLNKKEIETLKKEQDKINNSLQSSISKTKNYQKLMNKKKELQRRIEKADKISLEFSQLQKKYPNGMNLATSLCIFNENRGWYIYGATGNQFRELLPAYFLVDEMIKISFSKTNQFLDLFGVSGEINQENGLYTFKKGFGGEALEFIGEFDLPINLSLYYVFTKVYPQIKKFRRG